MDLGDSPYLVVWYLITSNKIPIPNWENDCTLVLYNDTNCFLLPYLYYWTHHLIFCLSGARNIGIATPHFSPSCLDIKIPWYFRLVICVMAINILKSFKSNEGHSFFLIKIYETSIYCFHRSFISYHIIVQFITQFKSIYQTLFYIQKLD